MPKQPAWAQTMMRKGKEIPVQMTVVARHMAPSYPPQQQIQQPQGTTQSFYDLKPLLPTGNPGQPPAGSTAPTFTGNGVDGILQPGKMTGQVHEGEFVMPANVVQNFTPQELTQFNQAAASGTLDKNLFNQAIGLPPVREFRRGGLFTSSAEAVKKEENPEPRGRGNEGGFGMPEPGQAGSVTERQNRTYEPQEMILPTVKQPEPEVARVKPVEPTPYKPAEMKLPEPQVTPQPQVAKAPEEKRYDVLSGGALKEAYDTGFGTYTTDEQREAFDKEYRQPKEKEVVTDTGVTPAERQQSQMSVMAENAVRESLQRLLEQSRGMTDADRKIMNAYLTQTDATDAANLRVLESRISADPTMSVQGKNAAILGVQREMNALKNRLSTQLATGAAERAAGAAGQLGQFGQQVRSYEDVTLPTTDVNLRAAEEQLRQAQETYNNYTTEANRVALETAKQNLENLKSTTDQAAGDNINSRISTLMSIPGANASTIASDPILSDLINQYYGGTATPEQLQNEIAMRVGALSEQNKAQYASNAEILMGDALDTGKTLEQVVADQSIRQAINGLLGGNATEQQITEEIMRRYDEVSKSDVDVAVENIVRSGLVDEYATYNTKTGQIEEKFPGFISDLESVYKDLMLNGAIDPETGLPREGAVYSWPWDDPKTYFKYNDWNGNAVSPGQTMGNSPVINTTTGKPYVDGTGMAVTNAAANAKWNQLSPAEKEALFTNGEIDVEKAMRKMFPTATGVDGNTVPVTTSDDVYDKFIADESYRNKVSTIADNFTDNTIIDKDIITQLGEEQALGLEGMQFSQAFPGSFIYYDESGKLQYEPVSSPKFAVIVQQLADVKNNGVMFDDVKQFNTAWNNGKGWFIDSDGNITNISTPGKNQYVEDTVMKMAEYEPNKFTSDELALISNNWDAVPDEMKASGGEGYLDNLRTFYRNKEGMNRWSITDEAKSWVNKNVGQLYRSPRDGRIYIISGIYEPVGVNTTAKIRLIDYDTGKEVYFSNGPGGGEVSLFDGEPYA